jgi:hypothetical protein
MSNSATSAAKRRRAAPFMSTPLLSPSSGNNSVEQQASFQNTQQGQSEPKLLTLQQVIALVDSRLTNLEKNVGEIKSQPSESHKPFSESIPEYNNEDVKQTVESIMYEYLSEFNERCEILATEISSIKNIVIELQSYTMNVNRILLEEKMKILSSATENVSLTNETQTIIITSETHSQTDNIDQSSIENFTPIELSDNALEDQVAFNNNDNDHQEVENCEIVKENDVIIPEDQTDITIVSKSSKKRGGNKKSQITLEQE